jgi:hypothetical protein
MLLVHLSDSAGRRQRFRARRRTLFFHFPLHLHSFDKVCAMVYGWATRDIQLSLYSG